MNEIRDDIERLGSFADASAEQVAEARKTRAEIEERLEQVRARFDILAASRIDDDIDTAAVSDSSIDDVTEMDGYKQAQEVLASTDPLHFPAAFPEVFDGEDSGFDMIVGNPPWEKAKVERHEFWARHYPGLRGLTSTRREERIEEMENERPDLVEELSREQREEEKRARMLTEGPYPGIGGGDPDMYLAFSWRFWNLVTTGGNVGVVLPRSAFGNASSEEFRRTVLEEGEIHDLTFLKNSGYWAFDGMEQRYTIALFTFEKRLPGVDATIPIRGPYSGANAFEEGVTKNPHQFPIEQAKNWTGSAAFPLLPTDPRSVGSFGVISEHPNLDLNQEGEWRARPNTELHATQDKAINDGEQLMYFDENPTNDFWPVYKGASFAPPDKNLWDPDTGVRYAWGDPDVLVDLLDERREGKGEHWASAFYEMSEEWLTNRETLPCLNPRVAFRDVTNRTNQRTVCAALVPPRIFLNHTAPYFLWPRGDQRDEAYLLGVLSSIPLDWYARRFVETHLTYHILNAFPIPRPGPGDSLRQRVVELSGRLAAVDDRYEKWADAVGVECGPLDEDTKQEKIYELDAVVAHLYGLTREHVQVIFETFHRGWDYDERLAAVLEYYDSWADRLGPEHKHQTETAETDD